MIAVIIVAVTFLFYFGSKIGDLIPSKTLKNLEDVYTKVIGQKCEKPLVYSLGSIDSRFGLTESEVLEVLREVELVWESSLDKDLFVYEKDSADGIKVSFIFDERQAEIFASRSSGNDLEQKWQTYKELGVIYNNLASKYKEALVGYHEKVSDYEEVLDNFNKKTKAWNRKLGSKSEFESLKNEEVQIKKLFNDIEEERNALNGTSAKLTDLGNQIDVLYKQFDLETDIHNDQYSGGGIEKSGDYGNYEINVYQFLSRPGLRLTLAHEMGHALGIKHTENSSSIMYYLLEDQDTLDFKLSTEDIRALKDVCRIADQ